MTAVDESGEDDVTQDIDCVRLGASTAGVDFDTYYVRRPGAHGMWCAVGSGSCVEEGQGVGGDDLMMAMKLSPNQCHVLWKHFVPFS